MDRRLIIVGSQAKAWTPEGERQARELIRATLHLLQPNAVGSGRSPGGGVDLWAEEEAARLGFTEENGKFRAFSARVNAWSGPGGFQARNLKMAEWCTHLLAIRSEVSQTYGSGWTFQRARGLGKTAYMTTVNI